MAQILKGGLFNLPLYPTTWVMVRAYMADDGKTARPWEAVAADLAKEHDPDQIAALVDELNNALAVDQQERKGGNLGPRQG